MGLWDKVKDLSGELAQQHSRRVDSGLNNIERQKAGRLNAEQKNKIDQARNDADRLREFAAQRRKEQNER